MIVARHSAPAHARQYKDADVFVPEGPDDGSQAIYCLEQVLSRFRPVGHGLILTPGLTNRPGDWHAYRTQPYRSLRDGSFSNAFQALKCLATII
jgi:hypothetical protein